MRKLLLTGLAVLLMAGAAQAANWTGSGDGVNWTDAANWSTVVYYPGQTGAPDNYGALSGGPTGVILDNTGGGIAQTISPNQSWGGSMTMTGGTVAMTGQTVGRWGSSTFTLQAGTINHDSGGQKLQIFDNPGDGAPSVYRVAGGTLNLLGGCKVRFNYGIGTAPDPTDNVFTIDAGTVTGGTWYLDDVGTTGNNGTFQVNGSGGTIGTVASPLVTLYAHRKGGFNLAGSAVLDFILDVSGVSPINVTTLDLGDGVMNTKGDLTANVSGRQVPSTVTLANYTTLLGGTFGSVAITDDTLGTLVLGSDPGGNPNLLALGEYYLDMGTGASDSVELLYNVPEPATLALMGLGGLGLLIRRKR